MRFSLLAALLTASAYRAVAELQDEKPIEDVRELETTLDLMHRVMPATSDVAPAWTQRGVLVLKHEPEAVPSSLTPLPADLTALYQVAIRRDGLPEEQWPMVSIPACRFKGSDLQDTVTVALHGGSTLLHFGYSTSASSDACRLTNATTAPTIVMETRHTKVLVTRPDRPAPPRLHEPVRIEYAADGKVVKPEPPKSFVAKYWMYIVPVLVLVMFSGGSDAPAAR